MGREMSARGKWKRGREGKIINLRGMERERESREKGERKWNELRTLRKRE